MEGVQTTRGTRGDQSGTWRRIGGEVNNVALKLLGTVPNATLSSDLGKEYHPPILGMLGDCGDQIKRRTVTYEAIN